MAKDYLKSRNLARAAARKLDYLHKKKTTPNSVHVVLALAHLCNQLDNNVDTSSDTEVVSSFECLVSTLDSNEGSNNVEILAVKIPTEARGSQMFEGVCVD